MGNIYVALINNRRKVGRAKDVEIRMKSLQTGCADKIEIEYVYEVRNDVKLENIIHYALEEYNIGGEFYNCSKSHIKYVIDHIVKIEHFKDEDKLSCLKNVLVDHFEKSEEKDDYVILMDIKRVLKTYNIKYTEEIKNIFKELFECELFERKQINNKGDLRNVFINVKKKLTNEEKVKLQEVLKNNYEIGEKNDYIQAKDIRKLCKDNGVRFDKNVVKELFECEFFEQKKIHYNTRRSCFYKIKLKESI
jgi:hypothetical protein